VQSARPPAALPAGPSASAAGAELAETTPSGDASVATEAEQVEVHPSAAVASPTGTVKPPPVEAVSQSAPPPLPQATPSLNTPAGASAFGRGDGDEAVAGPDDDTAPLPVILPDRMQQDQDAAASPRMRDPFEPIERSKGPTVVDAPGSAKMDQIKDLYLTAEAIGEDALSAHFQQVSDRQRQLIREYFDQAAGRSTEGQPKS
jgi:hypothetical protein